MGFSTYLQRNSGLNLCLKYNFLCKYYWTAFNEHSVFTNLYIVKKSVYSVEKNQKFENESFKVENSHWKWRFLLEMIRIRKTDLEKYSTTLVSNNAISDNINCREIVMMEPKCNYFNKVLDFMRFVNDVVQFNGAYRSMYWWRNINNHVDNSHITIKCVWMLVPTFKLVPPNEC